MPVRILLDLRADANYPANASVRQSFINAGIPIRHKTTPGINHWKMILYAGQAQVHFSAANFANGSYSPVTPYTGYVDEAIYFTGDPDVVHTFMTKYDDLWTDTTHYANLANVGALTRHYPTYPMDPELNFPPDSDYENRLVSAMRPETQAIDVVMFRITSGKAPDEMIRRAQAGVPIRLITDRRQYRNRTYFWHSYNIDRMFVAGIPIKWKVDSTDQDVHQKSVVLHGQRMAVFGSSNWTGSSSDKQREHNYFTRKPWFVDWFAAQFLRKWNNQQIDGTAHHPDDVRRLRAWLARDAGQSSHRRTARSAREPRLCSGGRAAGGRTSTTSTSGRPTRRRSLRRTTCQGRRPLASVPPRNPSTPVHLLRRSSRFVRQGSRPGPPTTG